MFFDLKLISKNKEASNKKDEKESNLEIKNSILNNMKFINCDFSEAEGIEIENSSLTRVEFINVDWGKITEKRIYSDPKKPEKARDVYRQIKLALDNQKDYINANAFYALEMRAYEKVLKQKSWKSHFQEKLVFIIHKISSNFGQSWIKPLLWIVFFTILMSLYFHREEIDFSLIFKNGTLNYSLIFYSIISAIENFFKTLNVFRIFRNVNDFTDLPLYYTLNSLYTILIAFLTYQVIVAIRRRVKR